MTDRLKDFNDRWLQAWTDKDVPELLRYYAPATLYRDPQVPAGVRGHAALKAHLEQLFATTPPMRYQADQIWPTEAGYCGRWYCTITPPDGPERYLRGFDVVELAGEEITFNEVYVHQLTALPQSPP